MMSFISVHATFGNKCISDALLSADDEDVNVCNEERYIDRMSKFGLDKWAYF